MFSECNFSVYEYHSISSNLNCPLNTSSKYLLKLPPQLPPQITSSFTSSNTSSKYLLNYLLKYLLNYLLTYLLKIPPLITSSKSHLEGYK